MTDEITPTQRPMSNKSVKFLVGYLLITAAVTFYIAYSLWAAEPLVAAREAPVPGCAAGPSPRLTNIYPNRVSLGSPVDVLLIGCGLPMATVVKFNGTQHQDLFVDASHIRVGLTAADMAAAGTVVVTLSSGGVDFGSGLLIIAPSAVYWQVVGRGPWPINQEVQILLMVLFTGALGSCIYALKSLADYRGDGKLYETWFTYYAIQPFEGAGIAYLLYLVIRGGFLAGGADGKTVNAFGMCAIAGLAGAFSDTAFLKLREVFQTLFKPQDDRGGKLTPKIITSSLPDGVVGAHYQETLQASGGTAPLRWMVIPALPGGLTLDASTGIISGTPTTASPKARFSFTVIDSGTPPATASADLTLQIK